MTATLSTLHRAQHVGFVQRLEVPVGMSIEDIALKAHATLENLTAWVRAPDGHTSEWIEVPRAMWSWIKPKVADAVMFGFRPGNNNILRSVFAIAATIIATVVAPYLAPIIGTFGAALVSTAITVGAALAANALFPAEAPTLAAAGQSPAFGQDKSSTFRNVDSDSNILAKEGYLPMVFGKRRLSLTEIAQPRPFLQDGIQSIDRLFALDGAHKISDIQIDGSPVGDLDSVTTQIIEGFEADPTDTFITKISNLQSIGEALSSFALDGTSLVDQDTPANSKPRWTRFSTASDSKLEEITIRLRVESLFKSDSASGNVRLPARLRFRPKGSTGAWTNLPEVHMVGRTTQTVLQEIRIRWDSEFGSSAAVGDISHEFFYTVPAATSGTLSSGATGAQWTADAAFTSDTVRAGRDGIRVTLNEDTFSKQEYEFEIKRGAVINQSDFSTSNYTISGTVHSFFEAYSSGGWRIHAEQGVYPARLTADFALALVDRKPCQKPGTCLIALRSVGQSVRNVTALCERYVNDWDGAGWNTLTVSENPATHFRQLTHDYLTYHGINTDLIPSDEFVAWRAEAIARGYKVSAVAGGETIADVWDQIAAAGFARKKLSDIFGIDWFRDRSGDRPVQVFSPRNASISFEWNHRPQPLGIRSKFQNEDTGYRDDELQVSNPIYASERGYDVRTYRSIADPDLAEMRAFFDLLQAQYQTRRVYMVETALEGMMCDRGDLIGIVSDLVDDSSSGTRISSVLSNTTFEIDQILPPVPTENLFSSDDLFAEGNLFDIGLRSIALIPTPTGTQEVTVVGVQGRTIRVSPAIDIADPQDLKGSHIIIGTRERLMRRVIVGEVVRGQEERATLVCVDEAPEIYEQMSVRYYQ